MTRLRRLHWVAPLWLLCAALPAPVAALGLGELNVATPLGEPLQAVVELRGVAQWSERQVSVTASAELPGQPPQRLTARFEQSLAGATVLISSRQRFDAPLFQLQLVIQTPVAELQRSYSVALALPTVQSTLQPLQPPQPPSVLASDTVATTVVPQPAAVRPQPAPQSVLPSAEPPAAVAAATSAEPPAVSRWLVAGLALIGALLFWRRRRPAAPLSVQPPAPAAQPRQRAAIAFSAPQQPGGETRPIATVAADPALKLTTQPELIAEPEPEPEPAPEPVAELKLELELELAPATQPEKKLGKAPQRDSERRTIAFTAPADAANQPPASPETSTVPELSGEPSREPIREPSPKPKPAIAVAVQLADCYDALGEPQLAAALRSQLPPAAERGDE